LNSNSTWKVIGLSLTKVFIFVCILNLIWYIGHCITIGIWIKGIFSTNLLEPNQCMNYLINYWGKVLSWMTHFIFIHGSELPRLEHKEYPVGVMVFNATFNNISVISWPSVLLMEETREKHRPAASHWETLSVLY
jgi:hypothetical protein